MTGTRAQQLRQIHKTLLYARLRYLVALVAGPCAILLSASLAVDVILATVGSQAGRSRWQPWLAAITIMAAFGIVTFRLRGRIDSLYKTAQILDARANLRDGVSTAWFLLQNSEHAKNPLAIAHIADAVDRITQVQLGKLFPLPRKTLVVAATMAVLLILANATSLPPTSTAVSKAIGGQRQHTQSTSDSNPVENHTAAANEKDFAHEEAVRQGDAPIKNATPGQQPAPLPQVGQQAKVTGTDADIKDQQGGLDRVSGVADERQRLATSPTPANRPPGAANGETAQNDRREGKNPQASDAPARSFVSELVSPLKRLFGAGQGHENQTRANSTLDISPAPSDSKRATNKDEASTAAVAHDQQPALPGGAQYGSADPSAKQTSSRKPGGLPSSNPSGDVQPIPTPLSTHTPHSAVESVGTRPDGEMGQTRVQAVRSAAARPATHSFNFDHRQDSDLLTAREDVPLAYRSRIQAYMEAARDQPRSPDDQGKQF